MHAPRIATKRMLISIEVDVPVTMNRRTWNDMVLNRLSGHIEGIVFIATEEIDPQVLLHLHKEPTTKEPTT